MNNEELLGKIAEFLNPIAKDISQIKTALLQMKTAGETLKAGQDDLREELAKKADKADIHRLEQKIDKVVKLGKKQEQSIANIEEQTGIASPHKN